MQNMSGTHQRGRSAEIATNQKSGIRPPATAVALAAVFAAGLGGCGSGDKTASQATTPVQATATPQLVTQQQLVSYAKTLPKPVYWAGPRPDISYELTRTAGGSTYVRYLPKGVAAGDPRPIFLTVGTYPRPNAFATVQQAAKRNPRAAVNLPAGGLAVPSPRSAKSVYLSYPKSPVLVEIFSTDPARSLSLARQRAIVPVQ